MIAGSTRGLYRDSALLGSFALALRLAVVGWAAPRFPPAADGQYFHQIAIRVAQGNGYTWVWPDGAVTYAAHYPVGYPGAVGLLYAIFGVHTLAAMLLGAALGAAAAVGLHRAAARYAGRRRAFAAGLLVAVHPGLLLYTPALMTEGITAGLLACAVWATARARERGRARDLLPLGVVLGLATLVRPQSIALAPLFGALALTGRGACAAARGAVVALCMALAVCAPWTARNCARMGRCALVSVNGGWNLLIGTQGPAQGGWAPVSVPPSCSNVWDEAQKDACFGAEAVRAIRARPLAWLARIPSKLAATFDYCGAAGWYLHESNAHALSARGKLALGIAETAFERVVLLAALLAAGARAGFRARPRVAQLARVAAVAVGVIAVFHEHCWPAYVALCVLGVSLPRHRGGAPGPVLPMATVLAVTATALTHAVFFGGGRYALVVLPMVAAVAAAGFAEPGELRFLDRPRSPTRGAAGL